MIAFTKYVSITSSVQGSPAVSTRLLIPRVFTTNPLVPTQTLVEFDTADEVGAYFGLASEEYKRAVFLFSWISKNNTRARKMSFARWAKTATAAQIYGYPNTYSLGMFTPITAGTFALALAGVSRTVSVNFGAAGSLAAVAAVVQAAIRTAGSADGTNWTAATVAYDATRGSFQFVGGDTTTPATITVTDGTSTPAAALGWTTGALLSNGVAAETITQTLAASAGASNNFGSFCFTTAAALSLQNVTDGATWNATQNVDYQFTVAVSAANAAAWSAAVIGIEGTELTLLQGDALTQFHEMMPMAILAATDYAARDGVQNFMYQTFPGQTPTVTDTALSTTYDNLRVNYYGATQMAGNILSFYQRSTMTGGVTAPVDMNVYANEQWLKDAVAAVLMNLLLSVGRVPTNQKGRAQLIGQIMSVVQLALFNGTISVGKPLTPTQITVIGELSDEATAWRQVQSQGYWLDGSFSSYVTADSRTEWEFDYTLIYSKDDTVRKVVGSHVLI